MKSGSASASRDHTALPLPLLSRFDSLLPSCFVSVGRNLETPNRRETSPGPHERLRDRFVERRLEPWLSHVLHCVVGRLQPAGEVGTFPRES